jgi:Putative beta barrel porin-7 (BBP7)
MRKWCVKLGLVAGLVSLVGTAVPARAQFGCDGGAPLANLQQQPDNTSMSNSLPNDGSPGAFSDCFESRCWTYPVIWGEAEYLRGITKRAPLGVPLATTSTAPNNSTNTGAIGQTNTVVLFGNQGIDLQYPEGMRFTLGVSPTRDWLIPAEVVYTYLHQRTNAFSQESDATGSPLLARPIFSNGSEQSILSSSPGLYTGGINVDSSLQLWGFQGVGVVRTELQCGDDCCGWAIGLPIGFRYLNLNELINVTSTADSLANGVVTFQGQRFVGAGNQTAVTDIFKGNNEFRGGEVGVRFETRMNGFSLMLEPRISIGSTDQVATITGMSTLTTASGATQTAPSGILAVASNSGRFARNRFTYLPEGTAHLAWQCFPWMRIQAGYNITYWPNVERPGNEINRAVSATQIPTSAAFNSSVTSTSPTFLFKDSTFLMQDVSIGVVFSY